MNRNGQGLSSGDLDNRQVATNIFSVHGSRIYDCSRRSNMSRADISMIESKVRKFEERLAQEMRALVSC